MDDAIIALLPSLYEPDDPLVAAILAAPQDDAPRLVWADRAGGERGELVVLQCALAGKLSRRQRKAFARRERQLLAAHLSAWSGFTAFTGWAWPTFVRGFVERARTRFQDLAGSGPAMFLIAPHLREIVIDEWPEKVEVERLDDVATIRAAWERSTAKLAAALAARLPLGRVRALTTPPVVLEVVDPDDRYRLHRHRFGADLVRRLVDAPAFALLESLALRDSGLARLDAVEPLRTFSGLRRLEMDEIELSAREVHEVLSWFPRVRDFGFGFLDDYDGEKLQEFLRRLEPDRLDGFACNGHLDSDGLDVLARYSHGLSRIRRLRIKARDPFRDAAELFSSPNFAAVTDLELDINMSFDRQDFARIARAPFARTLRRLSVRTQIFDLGPQWIEELKRMPALERIELPLSDDDGIGSDLRPALEKIVPDVHFRETGD